MKKATLFIPFLIALSASAADLVDRVVAVVGDEIVTLSDVRSFSSRNSMEAHLLGSNSQGLTDPVEGLIRDRLLRQELERLQLNATNDEVEKAIDEIAARNQVTSQVLKSELQKQGKSLTQYKKDISEQIRRMKFMGQVIYPRIRIADEEIAKKAGKGASEEARFRARLELLESRAPEEIIKFVDELRAKTYVEIKK